MEFFTSGQPKVLKWTTWSNVWRRRRSKNKVMRHRVNTQWQYENSLAPQCPTGICWQHTVKLFGGLVSLHWSTINSTSLILLMMQHRYYWMISKCTIHSQMCWKPCSIGLKCHRRAHRSVAYTHGIYGCKFLRPCNYWLDSGLKAVGSGFHMLCHNLICLFQQQLAVNSKWRTERKGTCGNVASKDFPSAGVFILHRWHQW